MGWVPIRNGVPAPEARPPGYLRVTDKRGERMVRKETPSLPAMPTMLAEEPGEQAITAGALKAMMGTDFRDDAQTKAIGGAIRALVVGALFTVGATFAWGAGFLLLPEIVGLALLPVAWLAGIAATIVYTLASEGTGRKYSAAGVERLKIETAREMHLDRLEARQQMHHDAVEAWENVLTAYLDKEYRQ